MRTGSVFGLILFQLVLGNVDRAQTALGQSPGSQPTTAAVTILAWNVEYGGSDLATIKQQLQSLGAYDILALSEVTRSAASEFTGRWGAEAALVGQKGGDACLLIGWNPDRFEKLQAMELQQFDGQDLAPGAQSAPLIVHLQDKPTSQQFIVVMNHLARGSAELRKRQASLLVAWAKQQTVPIVAVGGYNFDYDFPSKKGNESFDTFLADGTWKWVEPKHWVDTNWADRNRDGKDDYPDSMLDFTFTAGAARQWKVTSEVIVREGDFPDDAKTSDQRPLRTVVELPSKSAAESLELQVLDVKVVSWDAARYHGWPTLTRKKNGELLLVCSGGRESHVCPFGQLYWMRSKDHGATWSYPQVLYDGPIDDRDAGVVETAQGSILVTNFTSLAYEPILTKMQGITAEPGSTAAIRLQRWQAVHNQLTAEQRRAEFGTYMLRSTDGGINWSARYVVPVNSPHGPVVLRDGRLIYPGKSFGSDGKIGVCESTDDGLNWKWLATIGTRAGDDVAMYHELHAVEAADGTIICHIRNENKQDDGETLQSESTDGGRTWTVPHRIGVWGLPSHLLRLKDGRLLMSYGYRRKPFGNQVRISSDHGKTWSEPLTLTADGAGGDLGYPSTVECDDGSFVSVWYEVLAGSPSSQLRQARWRLR